MVGHSILFSKKAEDIRESIKEISAKVEDVKYKQSRILSSPEADVCMCTKSICKPFVTLCLLM